MTTEELEQLMKAHKCYFSISTDWTRQDECHCELSDENGDVIGHGMGPSIVEAVYEALKSKCKDRDWTYEQKLALEQVVDSFNRSRPL